MTTLRKTLVEIKVPPRPAIPGLPGSPGVPARPAYTYISHYTRVADTNGWEMNYIPYNPTTLKPAYYVLEPPGTRRARETGGSTIHRTEYRMEPVYVTVPARPAIPPVAPIPGIPPAAGYTYFDLRAGWNSGAYSIGVLPEGTTNGVKFHVPTNVAGVVVGLASKYTPGFAASSHGLYFSRGRVTVVERGVTRTSPRFYTLDDEFRIQRRGSAVDYFVGTERLHTSSVPSLGSNVVVASLYIANDTVVNAALFAAADARAYGSGSAEMLPLAGFAGEGNVAQGVAAMLPLTSTASVIPRASGEGVMLPARSLASNKPYAEGVASMEPFAQGSSDEGDLPGAAPTPEIGIGSAVAQPFEGVAIGTSGTVGSGAASMRPARGRGSDHNYAEGEAEMRPLESWGGKHNELHGFAHLTMPGSYEVRASGADTERTGAALVAPAVALVARGAGRASMRLPKTRLVARGTVPGYGVARLVAPAPTLAASGTTGGIGQAALTAPGTSFSARAGGQARLKLRGRWSMQGSGTVADPAGRGAALTAPRFALVARGSVHHPARARLVLPGFALDARGTVGRPGGRAALVAPALVATPRARAALVMPGFVLRSVSGGTVSAAAVYEAYAVCLQDNPTTRGTPRAAPPQYAVSRFSNYPFDAIVRFGPHYIGAGPEGLFVLDGDTDDGEPILWALRPAQHDFGAKNLKRMGSVYVGGRLEGEVAVAVITGDDEQGRYPSGRLRGPGLQTHRVKTPRGLRARHFGVELASLDGAAGEITSLELEVEALRRTI